MGSIPWRGESPPKLTRFWWVLDVSGSLRKPHGATHGSRALELPKVLRCGGTVDQATNSDPSHAVTIQALVPPPVALVPLLLVLLAQLQLQLQHQPLILHANENEANHLPPGLIVLPGIFYCVGI